MERTRRELIYFDPTLNEGENFCGKLSPVGQDIQKEYLKRYARDLKSFYGLGDLPEKVVPDEETDRLTKAYALKDAPKIGVLSIDRAAAFVREKRVLFDGWQLYDYGGRVEGDTLLFDEEHGLPLPAAKYLFPMGERLRSFRFSLRVEEFFRHSPRKSESVVAGEVFELRAGGVSVVKLQLFHDGWLYYLDGSQSLYHPELLPLVQLAQGEWHTVELTLGKEACRLEIDGEKMGKSYPLYSVDTPDNLFLGSGAIPLSAWRLRPERMTFDSVEITDFFTPAKGRAVEETPLGEVDLPFVVGTQAYEDQELVFRKRFDRLEAPHAKLTLKSVDPCGAVYLNGNLLGEIKDFLRKEYEIGELLQEKDNLLEIVVYPRSPEVFYQWHRHKDPYNGWFFRGGFIEFYGDCYIDELASVTRSVTSDGATAKISYTLHGKGSAKLFLQKIYPEAGETQLLDEVVFGENTRVEKEYTLSVSAWSCQTPTLYRLLVQATDDSGKTIEKEIETGFRTIEQKNGEVLLNGKRVSLNGALAMQFLPPYDQVPVNHLCPTDGQILTQLAQVKAMNGNTLRLHFLGYGSNDERYARFADRMGCMLIWTTRLIDSVESILFTNEWRYAEAYAQQVKEVRQYPSIVMWEGSNEASGKLAYIDKIYDEFVSAVKKVDESRLLCPCSHLYYGGGLYQRQFDNDYYQDDGKADQDFTPAQSSFGWTDSLVVRSAHTYALLFGYGRDWEFFTQQAWSAQDKMLESVEHAYIVSEYAVIGRACGEVAEAKEYFNPDSYELGNEYGALGFWLSDEEYELSQAHQALCAWYANKKMRLNGVDGMLWCCLTGGANDGSYLKPAIDFYGYAKFAFYTLKDGYDTDYCVIEGNGPYFNANKKIRPTLLSEKGAYRCLVRVENDEGRVLCEKTYTVDAEAWKTPLAEVDFTFPKKGFYFISTVTEKIK